MSQRRGDFGSLARSHRQELGLSLRQTAERLGLSLTYVSDVERGRRPPPPVDRAREWSAVLGADPLPFVEAARWCCGGFEVGWHARDAEVEHLRQQNAALREAINRDKTGLAKALEKVTRLCKGYDWATVGRGPYAWDDDEYRAEFGRALEAIHTVAYAALVESGTLAIAALAQAEPEEPRP